MAQQTKSPVVLEGTVNGRYLRRTLEPGEYQVGRTPDADVYLMHRSVSRNHAVLKVAEGVLSVRDLESRNGTFLNEQRVAGGPVVVRQNDLLRFGAIELRLVDEDAPWAKAPSTENLLSGAETLHAATRLSWTDLQETRADSTSALFQVLVEAAPLLVQQVPLEDLFESVLGLIERLLTVRRVLLLLEDSDHAVEATSPDRMPARVSAGSGFVHNLVLKAARPQSAVNERMMLSGAMMETVLTERSSLLVVDAQADERFKDRHSIVSLDVRSAMVAPLFDNEQVIGLIYADTNDPLIRYDDNQLRAFTLLANLIAVKITQTKLLEEQREKERLAQEMATAARIQKSLLPRSLPGIEGYEIYATQMPCFETAGDLYDVTALENGSTAIVLGDVSGKGLGAALLMSNVMASLRILYEEPDGSGRIIERLNHQVHRSTETAHFVTLFFGRLDPRNHRLEYVNAGHNAPLLVRAGEGGERGDERGEHAGAGCERAGASGERAGASGERADAGGEHAAEGGERVVELAATGVPVGIIPHASFGVETVTIPDDAILCIFTDGIPEAEAGGEFYEEARIIAAIRNRFDQPLESIADGLFEDLRAFLGDHDVGDDITLLLLRRSNGTQTDPGSTGDTTIRMPD